MIKRTSARQKLVISNLYVSIEGRDIVKGIDLVIKAGEMHAVMGPNGSGKSTLTSALMGHPLYRVVKGEITFGNRDLLKLPPHERARAGIILAFQNPVSIPGVTLSNFLRTAYHELYGDRLSALDFHKFMNEQAARLSLESTFLRRSINDGFSGGEKKKAEMLQLLVLRPKIAIFDEIDTGLDIDALKVVSAGINVLKEDRVGILLITHYQRILNYVQPDRVHVMMGGRIVKSGGPELAKRIEEEGYATIQRS